MINLTRPQREALKRIHMRNIGTAVSNLRLALKLAEQQLERAESLKDLHEAQEVARTAIHEYRTFRYRDLRRLVVQGPDCVMVPYAGMWLGIEPDGYTHS